MARVLRGEIRWADQARRRPVLVLSHDVFNERSGTVIAAAITSQPQRAGFPLTLELQSPSLPKQSWVKIGQIQTLSRERIGSRLARATPKRRPSSSKACSRSSPDPLTRRPGRAHTRRGRRHQRARSSDGWSGSGQPPC